jgi:hypothetical protein
LVQESEPAEPGPPDPAPDARLAEDSVARLGLAYVAEPAEEPAASLPSVVIAESGEWGTALPALVLVVEPLVGSASAAGFAVVQVGQVVEGAPASASTAPVAQAVPVERTLMASADMWWHTGVGSKGAPSQQERLQQ